MKIVLKVFALLVLFVCSYGHTAMATVFNCKTVQAGSWEHGRFDRKSNQSHVVLKFDDEAETLSSAFDDSYKPMLPQHFQVLQKKTSGYDLIALSEIKGNGHIISEEMLQISGWEEKEYGLTFLFWNGGGSLLSGKCEVEKQPSNDSKQNSSKK